RQIARGELDVDAVAEEVFGQRAAHVAGACDGDLANRHDATFPWKMGELPQARIHRSNIDLALRQGEQLNGTLRMVAEGCFRPELPKAPPAICSQSVWYKPSTSPTNTQADT